MISTIKATEKQNFMPVIIVIYVHTKIYAPKVKTDVNFRESINPAVEESKFFFYSDFDQEYLLALWTFTQKHPLLLHLNPETSEALKTGGKKE